MKNCLWLIPEKKSNTIRKKNTKVTFLTKNICMFFLPAFRCICHIQIHPCPKNCPRICASEEMIDR